MTPVFPLSSSSFGDYQRYLSMLAGNSAYAPVVETEAVLAEELITTNTSSVTFSDLVSSYSDTYNHLQIRAIFRNSTASNNFTDCYVKPNSYSGGGMRTHWLMSDGASASSSSNGANNFGRMRQCVAKNSAGSGQFGMAIMDIVDAFSTTKYKVFRSMSGGYIDGQKHVSIQGDRYSSYSAIDSLELYPAADSFVSGTRITLIGLK